MRETWNDIFIFQQGICLVLIWASNLILSEKKKATIVMYDQQQAKHFYDDDDDYLHC